MIPQHLRFLWFNMKEWSLVSPEELGSGEQWAEGIL